MWGQLIAAGIVLAVVVLMILAITRAAKRGGEMEERAEAEARRAEATAHAADDDRKAHERMADAQAASVGEPVSSVRDRMRKRPASTR